MAGVDEVGGLARGGVEGDFDGFAAGAGDSFGVLGPGLAVVLEVGAGRDGDGYARFHEGLDRISDSAGRSVSDDGSESASCFADASGDLEFHHRLKSP